MIMDEEATDMMDIDCEIDPLRELAELGTSIDRGTENRKIIESGARVACRATWDNLYHDAEVIQHREGASEIEYYVHYIEYNKRLDEWLPESRVEQWNGEPATTLGAVLASTTPHGHGTRSAEKLEAVGIVDGNRKLTRNLKRRYDEMHHVQRAMEELAPIDQTLEKEHEEKTKVKNIQLVKFGKYEINTWYFSPYPEEYGQLSKLYICEFCLKYMRKPSTLERHKAECPHRSPPGEEIFRSVLSLRVESRGLLGGHGLGTGLGSQGGRGEGTREQTVVMMEVEGRKDKLYCQNLCLFSKLFLDHKTLFFAVEPFLFYVLAEVDPSSGDKHIVGYFSKEINSPEEYNLACILTLPPHQRKGYGRLLIAFAYELSKREGRVGTPERPLSDLGQVSFRSYWTRAVLETLKEHKSNLSIKDISLQTAIKQEDIVSTLQSLNFIKYWKGQHIITASPRVIEEHLKALPGSSSPWTINQADLKWVPKNQTPTKRHHT